MVAKKIRPKRTNGKARIAVGSVLRLQLGNQKLTGMVVEDEGKLAPGGKHLYRIEIGKEPDRFSISASAADIRAIQA